MFYFNKRYIVILLACCGGLVESRVTSARQSPRKIPDGFLFGTATAAYQVEGSWNVDGKTESIWDTACHRVPSPIADGSSGDIANDSYRQYRRDVEMMRELGLDYYRFSISWPRILPTAFPDQINEAGVAYYNNLIEELLRYNIQPMVTIYHWDLPQKLQDLGGWANPNIIDWYTDYARVLFELFGDRVKSWITINEPREICRQGYGRGTLAPSYNMTGFGDYLCGRNVLLAHAKAYHIYDEEYRPSQNGTIFISISAERYEPSSDNEEDIVAAAEANLFDWGMYAHPIYFETGDYPQLVKERIAQKSAEQGFPRSRLPEFTPEEVAYIRGTSDFFGLNHYSTLLTYRNDSVIGYYEVPSFNDDLGILSYESPDWPTGSHPRVKTTPWGFYNLLREISETYNNVPIIITENGYTTIEGLEDDDRVYHFKQYINAVLDAIDAGSDIRAYTPWSLMDNFEWMSGYTQRFGLYEVDYNSPERTRTPRKSAFFYKEILRTKTLDMDFEPVIMEMTIDEGN